jgi:heme exporter protein D
VWFLVPAYVVGIGLSFYVEYGVKAPFVWQAWVAYLIPLALHLVGRYLKSVPRFMRYKNKQNPPKS